MDVIAAFILLGIIVISRVFAVYFFNKSGRAKRLKGKNNSRLKPDAKQLIKTKNKYGNEYDDSAFFSTPDNEQSANMIEKCPEDDC